MYPTTGKEIMPKIYKAERKTERLQLTGRNREMLNVTGDQEDAIQDHAGTPFFNRFRMAVIYKI